jgi:HNH endonuclease
MRVDDTNPEHRAAVGLSCVRCGGRFTVWRAEAVRGRRFCSLRCAKTWWASMTLAARFAHRVAMDGPRMRPELTACHVWCGHVDGDGYGKFGRKRATHVAYYLRHGEWPTQQINHHCDNPSCVNPDHLYAGSQWENRQDTKRRGRSLVGDRNPTRQHPEWVNRGEANGWSTLTEADVREMRAAYAIGESPRTIALRYGVNRRTAFGVVTGRSWRHVR